MVAITLQPAQRVILRDALFDEMSVQAERLDRALTRVDRVQRLKATRRPARRICRLAALLDVVGWGQPPAAEQLTIGVRCQLPLAAKALRHALVYAEDSAVDARALGSDEAALSMAAHLQGVWETLVEVQAQATRAQASA